MKNRNDDGSTVTPADGAAPRRDRRVISAIEKVFRLTHDRDMTPKERRDFGLSSVNLNHKKASDAKSSRFQDSKHETSELP